MKKQLQNYVPQFALLLAVIAIFAIDTPQSQAQIPGPAFTFKLDQHESVLNDQATLEILEAAIDAGILNGNDPAVQYDLSRAELQQFMSSYNALCTLKGSAVARRRQPMIAIGNGVEKSSNPTSPNYDPLTTPLNQSYYNGGKNGLYFDQYDRDTDPNNLHATNSDANIIGFKISLGSTANLYEFGILAASNTNAWGMVVPDNTSVSSFVQDNGNTLVISFDNGGLQPGQMATMQVQLSRDNATATTPWPSMTQFFSTDSLLTVVFQDPVTMDVTEADPVPFANFIDSADMWLDQLAAPNQHIDFYVPSYEIDGTIIVPVPEPGSIVLALGSLSGYFLLGRRRPA